MKFSGVIVLFHVALPAENPNTMPGTQEDTDNNGLMEKCIIDVEYCFGSLWNAGLLSSSFILK